MHHSRHTVVFKNLETSVFILGGNNSDCRFSGWGTITFGLLK